MKDPAHVRDFQATESFTQSGIDHDRFSYRYQGLDVKLTGVEKAHVVREHTQVDRYHHSPLNECRHVAQRIGLLLRHLLQLWEITCHLTQLE